MVDERRVRLLLQRIEDDLRYLTTRRGLEPQVLLEDEDRLAAVKYYLLTAIEGCLAVAQHLCAAEGWGPPTSNADAMTLLGARGATPSASSGTRNPRAWAPPTAGLRKGTRRPARTPQLHGGPRDRAGGCGSRA